MVSGKIKCAPPHIVVHWVSSTWTGIPAELVAFLMHETAQRTTFCGTTTRTIATSTTQAVTTYCRTAMMLVKTRIPHETKLPSVIQVPYSSTFVKITTVHVRITFVSKVFFKI